MRLNLKACVLSALLLTAQSAIADEDALTMETIKTHINLNGILLKISDNETKLGQHWLRGALGIDDIEDRITVNEGDIGYTNQDIVDLLEQLDTLTGQVETLQAQVNALHSDEDPETPEPEVALTPCFTFANTVNEDLTGNDWFDNCVSASATGDTIKIVLKDSSDTIVYESHGAIPYLWTQNQLTHNTGEANQVDVSTHSMIDLDNEDRLMIMGKNSDPGELARCYNSYANGYGLIIVGKEEISLDADGNVLPASEPVPKLYVMPYTAINGFNAATKRSFVSWSTGHEITYNLGGFQSCMYGSTNGMIDDNFIGTVEVYVFDSTQ